MGAILDFILGRKLRSDQQRSRRIGVWAGLPAMGLDGLSSSAYGPEAALAILAPLGAAGLHYILPITGVILALLAILYLSYRQTIQAYPANGGSYTVARENLGTWASLFAAAALMIDYVLTVAVGISAGVAALVSALPMLHSYMLPLCLGILAVITLLNLRGTAEAGAMFAIPTYLFIACMFSVLAMGIFRAILSHGHPAAILPAPALPAATESVGPWILLRAFASGCTAMTGVEAVSNSVGAFQEPTVKKAHQTLSLIVGLLALLLGGIAYLAHAYHLGTIDQNSAQYQSVLSQLVAAVVGRNWFFYVTIAAVLMVLCLSANTSFVGFPRLCRLIAKDDFLPRSFAAVDRRLVNSIGILFLAGASGLLLAVFDGITDRLIPLFAVGAFLAFTLSQAGMVMHWRTRLRNPASESNDPRRAQVKSGGRYRVRLKLLINATGAIATAAALAIILAAKFLSGAWITVLIIPAMITVFRSVHEHYRLVERMVASNKPLDLSLQPPLVVLLPIRQWDRVVAKAIRLGLLLSKDVVAIHLSNLEGDAANDEAQRLRKTWSEKVEAPSKSAGIEPPRLELARTPFREFVAPLMKAIDELKHQYPDRVVAVVIPEIVELRWWYAPLQSRRASRLRSALRAKGDSKVMVVEMPWFIAEELQHQKQD